MKLESEAKRLRQFVLKRAIAPVAIKILGFEMKRNLSSTIRTHIVPGSLERISELTNEGLVPLAYATHFTHLDPVVASDALNELITAMQKNGLGENLRGFTATLAKSVPGGQQSRFMQLLYPDMEAYAALRNVQFIPVTRAKDKNNYDMPIPHEEKFTLARSLRKKGQGALILPGGTVQAGRHPEGFSGDDIFGLQEVTDTNLIAMFLIMQTVGRSFEQKPYFLPVGIDRTFRFFNVDKLVPTTEGVISLYRRTSKALSVFGFERLYIDITLGIPITDEDLVQRVGSNWRKNPLETNKVLMSEAALLIPPGRRGVYA